ncbi:MAG: TonB-dependent receptor [Pseudomonadota bacterium]
MTLKSILRAVILCAGLAAFPWSDASAQNERVIDIQSQAMTDAVKELGRQTGLQIVAKRETLLGLRSKAVSAQTEPEEALGKMLSGTGLTYRSAGPNAVVIERVSQTNATSEPVILDQIVVEGELQNRTIQETQTSVVVIEGDELERRGDFDVFDVIERIPNVTSSFGDRSFVVRGINARGVGSGGSGLLINTSVDGVTLPDELAVSFGPYSTWDLEQVEVLRGPQSTQQGRNALAGAIVIRSADPTYETEMKARLEGGQRTTVGGAYTLNLPIIEDKVALRVSAEHVRNDGFVENPTLGVDDYDARRQTTVRAKLRFDPVEDLTAIASFSYARNFAGDAFVDAVSFPDERLNLSNVPAEEGSEQFIGGLRATYNLNERLSLESETGIYVNEYRQTEDLDRTADDLGFFEFVSEYQSIEQNFKLTYEGERFKGVLGGFFTVIEIDSDSNSTVTEEFFGAGDDLIALFPQLADLELETISQQTTKTTNFALFGEAEYRLRPELAVIAGARFDRETQRLSGQSAIAVNVDLPPIVPLPPDDAFSAKTTFNAFLPKFGVVYDWSDDLSTGFTVQRGYRAGGTRINAVTGQENEFDPEFTWNYELSLRSQWLDGRLTANANAFFLSWRDQQVNVSGPSGLELDFNRVNAGRSRVYGGELSFTAQPIDQLEVFGSVGIAETEFIDFVDNGQDFSGNEFPQASELTAAFGATYFFDNGIELGGDASYTSAAFTDAANTPELESDGRFLVNLQAGYEGENWGAFLYARNVFDIDYVLQPSFPDAAQVRTGEPLTVGAFLKFQL